MTLLFDVERLLTTSHEAWRIARRHIVCDVVVHHVCDVVVHHVLYAPGKSMQMQCVAVCWQCVAVCGMRMLGTAYANVLSCM